MFKTNLVYTAAAYFYYFLKVFLQHIIIIKVFKKYAIINYRGIIKNSNFTIQNKMKIRVSLT